MQTQQRQRCKVRYYIGSYSGTETVYCDANDDNEFIISKCKRQLRASCGGIGISLPMYSESYKITEREDYSGE